MMWNCSKCSFQLDGTEFNYDVTNDPDNSRYVTRASRAMTSATNQAIFIQFYFNRILLFLFKCFKGELYL